MLYKFKHYDEEELLEIIKENPCELQYIKDQTEEMCIIAVKRDGFLLSYVKNQTEKICLEAVKETCWALEYIEEYYQSIVEYLEKNKLNAEIKKCLTEYKKLSKS